MNDLQTDGIIWSEFIVENVSFFICAVYMPHEQSVFKYECDNIWKIIELGCDKLKERGKIIVVGDFNARTGSLSSSTTFTRKSLDKTICPRGRKLIETLEKNQLVILNGLQTASNTTHAGLTNRGKSVVDYIITEEEMIDEIGEVKIIDEGKLIVKDNNEHELMSIALSCKIASKEISNDSKMSDSRKDKRVPCMLNRRIPAAVVKEKMNDCMIDGKTEVENADNVELAWIKVKERINEAMRKLKMIKTPKPTLWFYVSEEIAMIDEEMKTMKKKCERYKKLKKKKRMLKRKRKQVWEKDLMKQYVDDNDEWKYLERCHMKGKKAKGKQFAAEGLFNEKKEIVKGDKLMEIAKKAWMDLGSEEKEISNEKKRTMTDEYEHKIEKIEKVMKETKGKIINELDRVIEREEVEAALDGKRMRCRKASDNIGLCNEMFRNGMPNLVDTLLALFQRAFQEGIPAEWKEGIIIPIYKGSGSRKSTDNYRGITILNIVGKIYCSILQNRLMLYCEQKSIIVEEQGGFRPKRGCRDQIYSLYEILNVRKSHDTNTFCCFVDFRKAYDRVWRRDMFASLHKVGIKGQMLDALKDMYVGVNSRVSVNGILTDSFAYDVGVRQGCILSPLLFSLWINTIAQSINNMNEDLGIVLDIEEKNISLRRCVKMLLYADDLVLLAENAHDLQMLLNELYRLTVLHRCDINENKTKVVVYGKKKSYEQISQETWHIGDKNVERVNEYKYLGIWFDSELLFSKTIKERQFKCLGVITEMKEMGKKNAIVPVNMIMKVLFSKVIGIMEYGSIVWSTVIKKKEWNDLEIRMREALRAILGITNRTVANVVIHGDLGVPSFESIVKRVRVMWWREIVCMPDSRLCKFIYRWAKSNGSSWDEMTNMLQHTANPKRDELTPSEWKSACYKAEENLWRNEIEDKVGPVKDNSKLRLYKLIKCDLKREKFLDNEEIRFMRNEIIEFRGGGSKALAVEQFSLDIPSRNMFFKKYEERLCPHCVNPRVEDVEHCLVVCERWDELREPIIEMYKQMLNELGDKQKELHKKSWSFERNVLVAILQAGIARGLPESQRKSWEVASAKFIYAILKIKAEKEAIEKRSSKCIGSSAIDQYSSVHLLDDLF